MPSPIGHSLAGYAAARIIDARLLNSRWGNVLLIVALANLPDIDFLLGLWAGDPSEYHRLASHSLTAVLAMATVSASVLLAWRRTFTAPLLATLAIVGSHVLLDSVGPDTHRSAGVPLLWPVSTEYVNIPIPMVIEFEKSGTGAAFFESLLTLRNLRAALFEVLVFLPAALAASAWRGRRLRNPDQKSTRPSAHA